MGRTLKDKNEKYLPEEDKPFRRSPGPLLSRRFAKFKIGGPPASEELCPDCGGLLESQDSYLTCIECAWTEDVVHFMDRMAA